MNTALATRPAPAQAPARSTLRGWLAVISVMMGLFSIVTTEILPIGLLTPIGAGFGVSDGTAGLMMTMPGLLAAVSAPTVTLATSRFDRRLMLVAFTLLLVLANFLAAVAPTFWIMLISRVMVGITIGGFWSIAAGLADRLVRPRSVPKATALIFSAVPLGSVLGVPLGTLIGDLAGWRAAFVVMGVLTFGVLAALAVYLPPLPPVQRTRLSVLRGMFRNPSTRIGLLVTFLIVLGHFGAYTFVRPFLQQVTHATPATITAFLLVYGAAGIAGNFIASAKVAAAPRATLATAAAMVATATLLLPLLGTSPIGALALLIVWGVAYGAVPVSTQTWFAKSAPQTPEAASVLFTASFQATFSLGALAGGIVVDSTSAATVMTLGGATAILVALATLFHFTTRTPWSSER